MENMNVAFSKQLIACAESDRRIIVVDPEVARSTKMRAFGQAYPDSFVEVGVAEQNAVGISAGLAAGGNVVFCVSFAPFATMRPFEIIRTSAAYPNQNVRICFQNVNLRESRTLNGSNRQPYLCEVTKCHFVEFSGCTLDANGITYDSVYARSSHVFLYNCGLYNALQGLECYLAQGNLKDCCGSCSWSMVSYASLVIASGTVPAGSRGSGENGLLYASNVTVDYGTAIPTVTPDETGILYATTTKSWRGSWRTDTLDVIQGVYYDSGYNSSLNWNRGCMWFSNARNLLSGCTVKSATLTLHRKTGSGSSAAKSVYLCAITNTSASGTPSIAKNYGSIGTIGRDKQVTFAIPVDAVQAKGVLAKAKSAKEKRSRKPAVDASLPWAGRF